MAGVDAGGAHIEILQQDQHAPRPGSDIEQRLHRTRPDGGPDRRFDGILGDMKRAEAVPARRILSEIGLRGRGMGGLDGDKPAPITNDDRILQIEPRQNAARRFRAGSCLGQPIVGPGALRQALDQAGLGHEFKMARNPRLALRQHLRQILDRGLAGRKQREQAKPCRLAGAAERGDQFVEGGGTVGHGTHGTPSADINISLCLMSRGFKEIRKVTSHSWLPI